MADIARLQKRIGALQTEATGLEEQIAELQRDHSEKRAGLQGLWAAAERAPSEETTRAADRAEREVDVVARQLERKRAALAACESDLVDAQAQLEQAQLADVVAQLGKIADQVEDLCRRIDGSPADGEAWAALRERSSAGNALYRPLRGSGRGEFVEIFADPATVRGRVFEDLAKRVDASMGLAAVAGPAPAMADLLGVSRSRSRIRSLQP